MVNQNFVRTSNLEARQRKLLQQVKRLDAMYLEAQKVLVKLQSKQLLVRRQLAAEQFRRNLEIQAAQNVLSNIHRKRTQIQTELQLIRERQEERESCKKQKTVKYACLTILVLATIIVGPLLLSMLDLSDINLTGAIIGWGGGERGEGRGTMESSAANSNTSSLIMNIYDTTDNMSISTSVYSLGKVDYYSNFTNSTGDALNSSTEYCEISFNDSGSFAAPINMTFNSSSLLHEYNKTYNSKGEYYFNISCYNETDFVNATDNLIIDNSVPTVPILSAPLNNTSDTNRTPELVWFNSSDNDNKDNLSYEPLASNNSDFAFILINKTIAEANSTNSSYLTYSDLPISSTVFWKVRSYDGERYSPWSDHFEYNVLTSVDFVLLISTVNFGDLGPRSSVNTTDSSFSAIEISNNGNVPITIDINATPFFNSTNSEIPGNYSFMIAEKEAESYLSALTNWTNMSESEVESIVQLYHVNGSNSANEAILHLLVVVPSEEKPGAKNSQITISGIMS
ncbi:hypothetical protein CL619_01200 [archaeon]|nr:hypothetical protein [archaeon]|tara:strand:- start:1172 stop:2701 length:1530 start_codon:yes stop_codon:yes gene_type:complete